MAEFCGFAAASTFKLRKLGQSATKAFQARSRHINPTRRPQPAIFAAGAASRATATE